MGQVTGLSKDTITGIQRCKPPSMPRARAILDDLSLAVRVPSNVVRKAKDGLYDFQRLLRDRGRFKS
jgi:hypothetical protein